MRRRRPLEEEEEEQWGRDKKTLALLYCLSLFFSPPRRSSPLLPASEEEEEEEPASPFLSAWRRRDFLLTPPPHQPKLSLPKSRASLPPFFHNLFSLSSSDLLSIWFSVLVCRRPVCRTSSFPFFPLSTARGLPPKKGGCIIGDPPKRGGEGGKKTSLHISGSDARVRSVPARPSFFFL